MYKVHQDAFLVPSTLTTGKYSYGTESVPALTLSVSIDKSGKMHISVCNLHATKTEKLTAILKGFEAITATGIIIGSGNLNDFNSFDNPEAVTIKNFSSFHLNKNQLEIEMPPHSVVTIEVVGKLHFENSTAKPKNPVKGILFSIYEGAWDLLPDLNSLQPVESGSLSNIEFPAQTRSSNFGLRYTGYFLAETEGMYTFTLASDDGSSLMVNGRRIILNDGLHDVVEREGVIYLSKGYHSLDLQYFQKGGGRALKVYLQTPGDAVRRILPEDVLFHEN
jgi:hypothetical protein